MGLAGHPDPQPARARRPQLPRPPIRRATTGPPGHRPGRDNAMSDPPPKEAPGVDGPTVDGASMRTELPAEPASARQARSAVRQALAGWGMGHLSGDAELLASEL